MSGVFALRPEPSGPGTSDQQFWQAATSQPFSAWRTLGQGVTEGALNSLVLGTAIREGALPQKTPQVPGVEDLGAVMDTSVLTPEQRTEIEANRQHQQAEYDQQYGTLDDAQQKASADFRPEIGVQQGMTAARQKAAAEWFDAKTYRERVLARSSTALSVAGQFIGGAADPINYIPVIGPEVRAAAIARWGFGGAIAASAADAALNTAIASAATAPMRQSLGDDVHWQDILSQSAMGALVGGAFGAAAHGLGEWRTNRALNSLENVAKARQALNDAVDGVVRGDGAELSPATVSDVARVQADPALRDQAAARVEQPVEREFAAKEGAPVEVPHVAAPTAGPVVFHGTLSDFNAFDAAHLGKESETPGAKEGFFFTSDRDVAQTYARANPYEDTPILRNLPQSIVNGYAKFNDAVLSIFGKAPLKQEGRVISAKLDIKNPLEVGFGGEPVNEAMIAAKIAEAKAAGHDGVVFRSMKDDGYSGETQRASDVWVAFKPDQIRVLDHGVYVDKPLSPLDLKPRALDTSTPAPEAPDPSVAKAATRIAKPEDLKAIAADHGVNPDTGEFREQADIAQLEAEGRLTAEDKAELEAADHAFEQGQAYGEALKAAFTCVVGAA